MSETFQQDVRMMRRLAETRRAQELPPTAQFDLAASDLDDDELEAMVEPFGQEYGRSGWGLSEVFQDLLSRDPKRVDVSDLKQLQENMKAQGYLPASYAATGQWDPQSQTAFRRLDRDGHDEVRAGNHFLAAPVTAGVRLITNTIPSKVFQGIVGAAKGMVKQAPETAERGGLVGGAVAGAAIGTAVAPGLGSLIGGTVGGIAGFAADFFGDDEGEEGQSGAERFVDALTPYEEYKAQGSKALFEDLGFVLSAVAMIRGAGMVGGAVKGGVGAIGTATSHGTTLRAAALAKQGVAQPGIVARVIGGGLNKVSPNAAKTWIDVARTHGLMAQTSRPLLKTINGVYTGASAGQMGARYAGGLGSGEDKTTIERSISEAPELSSWVDNTVGLVVYPSKLFPLKAKDAGRAIQGMLGDTNLQPWVHAAQKTPDGHTLSLGKAKERALSALGRDPLEQAQSDAFARITYGVNRRVGEMLHAKGRLGDELHIDQLRASAKSSVIRKLKAGGEESEALSRELMSYSHDEPMGFTGFLEGLEGRGSGIENFSPWRDAQFKAQKLTRDVREGRAEVELAGGKVGRVVDFDVVATRSQLKNVKAAADKARKKAARSVDPNESASLIAEADALSAEAKALQGSLAANPTGKASGEFTIVPAKKYDPENNIPGYATREEIRGLADEYDRKAQQVTAAYRRAAEGNAPDAWKAFHMESEGMSDFVDDLSFRGLIKDDLIGKAKQAEPSKLISQHLKQRAKHHGREVKVDSDTAKAFDELGYKPVATGEDVLFMDDLAATWEVAGVGDYTRRAAFFETLGLSPYQHSNEALWSLKQAHARAEVGQVLTQEGIPMTGDKALGRLNKYLSDRNHPGMLKARKETVLPLGPGAFRKGEDGTSYELFKIDVRELSPDDIGQALGLEDFAKVVDPGETSRKVYDALKRGGALGGETSLRHPLDSARAIGRNLRVSGLPGFVDYMRSFHIESPTRAGAIGGAAFGAAVGAQGEGDAVDALKGAAVGAVAGASLGRLLKTKFKEGTYGYLPEHLHQANMAIRYSLSPIFDLGRYAEQNILGAMKADLPPIFAPKRYIQAREFKSISGRVRGADISGEAAWDEAVRFWDDLNGGGVMKVVDDVDRRMFARGMVGFSPRHHEAAQAYLLKQRGMADDEIIKTVSEIGRYGLGRTGAEKSVNFVFFPFSFSKKFVTSMGDFIMQAPARNLLIHEGFRRYHEAGLDERFGEFIEKHLPIAKQVQKINNLAYGLSPGRFFLEGLDDNRTDVGKAMQILSSAFVPSGAATPVAQAAGGLGDVAMNLFSPVVVTGDNVDGIDDILDRYIPAVRDVQSFLESAGEQVTAVREGGTPYHQLESYLEEKREAKDQWSDIATALGYASVDGFLQSNIGLGFKASLDEKELELQEKYPTGFKMSAEFTNTTALDKKALHDLAEKPDRSEAEDLILELAEIEQTAHLMADIAGMDSAFAASMAQRQIRRKALEHIDDKRFVLLFNRFYAKTYGPLQKVAVA